MQVFDASSMIYAWDNYPIRQFPGVWDWVAAQVDGGTLVMPRVAHAEVSHKAPDCGEWTVARGITLIEMNNQIVQQASRIKELLGITNDRYHPEGVGENDLFIIATAKIQGGELISDEREQKALPHNLRKFKIPAVCAMPHVSVQCANFVKYMKRSAHVFR